MSVWDDIEHNESLANPMQVTVEKAEEPGDGHRSWALTVCDERGKPFDFNIFLSHDPGITFQEDHRYEIRGAMGQVWNDGVNRKLNSCNDLEVNHLGSAASSKPLRLFILSDTHVGYSHRPASNRVKWWKTVDCLSSIRTAVEQAIEMDVDAVVHGGDIYDEHATTSEVVEVESLLSDLDNADIPFFYIRGNHESSIGDRSIDTLQSDEVIRKLGQAPTTLTRNGVEVALYGTDYKPPGKHPDNVPTSFESHNGRTDVLMLHQSFKPVYPKGKLKLDQLSPAVPSNFPYVFIGHMHSAMSGTYGRSHIQYTGATDNISKSNKDNNPSAWLLSVTESGDDLERIPLST